MTAPRLLAALFVFLVIPALAFATEPAEAPENEEQVLIETDDDEAAPDGAEEAAPEATEEPEAEEPPAPPRFRPIAVSVEADRFRYEAGDPVRIAVRTDADAFVFIFMTDAQGITRQVVPSNFEWQNQVRRSYPVTFPRGGGFFTVSEPGSEYIHAFAIPAWAPEVRWPFAAHSFRGTYGSVTASPESLRGHFQRELRNRWAELLESFRMEREENEDWENPLAGRVWIPWMGESWTRINVEGLEERHAPGIAALPPVVPSLPRYTADPYRSFPARPLPPGYDMSWPYRPGPPFVDRIQPRLDPGQDLRRRPGDEAREGPLYVNASPGPAEVYINGIYVGQTPYNTRLREGRYDVTVYRHGYIPWEREVRIHRGSANRYSVRLQPARTRWY